MKKEIINLLKSILGYLSRMIISKFRPDIIAVTGSVGKTSAKEAIYAVLAHSYSLHKTNKDHWLVRRSRGNLNNELGMPLAIIANWKDDLLDLISRGQPSGTKRFRKAVFWFNAVVAAVFKIIFGQKEHYPNALILEYGADRPSDMKKMLKIAVPNIGVVTAIGQIPVHVEFYQNPEEVAKEKFKLIDSLPGGGRAVLNFDDEMVMRFKEKTKVQVITFGFGEGADVKISNFENRSVYVSTPLGSNYRPEGIFFKIEHQKNIIPVTVKNVFGRAQAYSVAAAFAVGIIYSINLVEIAELIERYYLPAKHRMNLIQGIKDSWIIDDSYNASPLSMKEAVETFKDLKAVRKIAVLGDMLELGKYSVESHESIGKMVADAADYLITVGLRGKFIAEKAKESGMSSKYVFSFDTVEESLVAIQNLVKSGDLILVKASRAIGLDKVVEEIKKI